MLWLSLSVGRIGGNYSSPSDFPHDPGYTPISVEVKDKETEETLVPQHVQTSGDRIRLRSVSSPPRVTRLLALPTWWNADSQAPGI